MFIRAQRHISKESPMSAAATQPARWIRIYSINNQRRHAHSRTHKVHRIKIYAHISSGVHQFRMSFEGGKSVLNIVSIRLRTRTRTKGWQIAAAISPPSFTVCSRVLPKGTHRDNVTTQCFQWAPWIGNAMSFSR